MNIASLDESWCTLAAKIREANTRAIVGALLMLVLVIAVLVLIVSPNVGTRP